VVSSTYSPELSSRKPGPGWGGDWERGVCPGEHPTNRDDFSHDPFDELRTAIVVDNSNDGCHANLSPLTYDETPRRRSLD